MGRPTKEEQRKREILLKYFRRDSKIYTSFEKATEGLNQSHTIGMLIDQCKVRNFKGLKKLLLNTPNSNLLFISELIDIDEEIHLYYQLIHNIANINLNISTKDFYDLHYYINKSLLIKLFGKNRVNTFHSEGYFGFFLTDILSQLSEDEKKQLSNYISKNDVFDLHTIINDMVGRYSYNDSSLNHLVEIDFNKPKKDILNNIENLIDEYNKGNLPNVFDYLGIKKYSNKKNILKTNSHKPFNILLADKLFIYDSCKIGLKYNDIINEIDNYSMKIQNIDYDISINEKPLNRVTTKTIKNYRDELIYLIDNNGYLDFEKTQIRLK